ncbi:MAG: transposase [Candidatus Desulfaltia sp.]|nr:transposase [Candidatus Desulfaltia sp.]
MLDIAAKVMKDIVKNFNKTNQKADPGIIMVLHPFGRDLKTNMHVHMLMTEGGLTSGGQWVAMPYIDYRIIRKKWQYEILTALKKALSQDKTLKQIIDWCFKEKTNGFNIQAKRRIEGKTKKAARYMARYVRHPAIADSRIIGYDTNNVTFVYEREGITRKIVMDKFAFIHNVIKHIPDAHFKMVRYYGIHGRRARKNVREIMAKPGLKENPAFVVLR